jgi:hypothetical protein
VNKLIDTGAVAAAYCVADESIDAFRRRLVGSGAGAVTP